MSQSSSNLPAPTGGDFILYQTDDGRTRIQCRFENETVWLTQKQLAELFGVKRPAITKHLLNIFSTGELVEDTVCSILEHTAGDGKTYSAKYYNLDAIIAVGYRVNSYHATQFRIWATNTLRELLTHHLGPITVHRLLKSHGSGYQHVQLPSLNALQSADIQIRLFG